MSKPSHLELALIVILLLLAGLLRIGGLADMPPGFSDEEALEIRAADEFRNGRITVFYRVGDEFGHEGLYCALLAFGTWLWGDGLFGYRILSAAAGMLTLVFLYALMRRLLGPTAAMIALAAMSVSFWPVVFSKLVLRQVMVPMLGAASAYVLVRPFRNSDDGSLVLRFTAGSVLLGLALYVHWSAIAMVATLAIHALVVIWRRREQVRGLWGHYAYALLIVIIVALPLIISSLRNPDLNELIHLVKNLSAKDFLQNAGRQIAALFWLGDPDPAHNLPGRPLLEPLCAALLLIGMAEALIRRKLVHAFLMIALIMGLIPGILAGGDDLTTLGAALPVIYALIGIGGESLVRWVSGILTKRQWSSGEMALRYSLAGLAVLLAASAALTYHAVYTLWAPDDDTRNAFNWNLGGLARYLETRQEQLPFSLCTQTIDWPRQHLPIRVRDRWLLEAMMHRDDIPIRYFDCRYSLVLADGGETQIIGFADPSYRDDVPPPLREWLDDAEPVYDPRVPAGMLFRLNVSEELAEVLGGMNYTAPTFFAPEVPDDDRQATLPVRLGGNFTFLGYTVGAERYRPGDTVEIQTFWRIDGETPPLLTQFVHILADPTMVIAQQDLLGVMSDALWPRDIIIQLNYVEMPYRMVCKEYTISVGLYSVEYDQHPRLPVFDDENRPHGDRLILSSILVTSDNEPE